MKDAFCRALYVVGQKRTRHPQPPSQGWYIRMCIIGHMLPLVVSIKESIQYYREAPCANAPLFLLTRRWDPVWEKRKGGEVGKLTLSTCRTAPDHQFHLQKRSPSAPAASNPYLFGGDRAGRAVNLHLDLHNTL